MKKMFWCWLINLKKCINPFGNSIIHRNSYNYCQKQMIIGPKLEEKNCIFCKEILWFKRKTQVKYQETFSKDPVVLWILYAATFMLLICIQTRQSCGYQLWREFSSLRSKCWKGEVSKDGWCTEQALMMGGTGQQLWSLLQTPASLSTSTGGP